MSENQQRVFVIADLHFGHKLVAELRGFSSTNAHDDSIVQAWNETVRAKDTVYVLGDVFRLERVPELNGVKKLVPGNHDQRPIARYAELFSKVQGCFEFDSCLLTHIPVHPNQFARYEVNVHGHMHERFLPDPRYACVSVEQARPFWRPFMLRDIIQKARKAIGPRAPRSIPLAD